MGFGVGVGAGVADGVGSGEAVTTGLGEGEASIDGDGDGAVDGDAVNSGDALSGTGDAVAAATLGTTAAAVDDGAADGEAAKLDKSIPPRRSTNPKEMPAERTNTRMAATVARCRRADRRPGWSSGSASPRPPRR